jgi:hypothetical protein
MGLPMLASRQPPHHRTRGLSLGSGPEPLAVWLRVQPESAYALRAAAQCLLLKETRSSCEVERERPSVGTHPTLCRFAAHRGYRATTLPKPLRHASERGARASVA